MRGMSEDAARVAAALQDHLRAVIIGDNYCNPQSPDYVAAMNTLNSAKTSMP